MSEATQVDKAALGGWSALCVAAGLGLAAAGLGGLLVLVGLVLLLVGVVALLRGRVRWARLGSRAAGAGAVLVAVVVMGVGSAFAGDPSADHPGADHPSAAAPDSHPSETATPSAGPSAPPASSTPSSPSVTASTAPSRGTALAAVARLRVGGRGPRTGYSREAFGQTWFDADRNGCDTRNDVLRRDLTARSMKNACKVLAGTLDPDPYTGTTVRFVHGGTSEVDVDHLVALSDAWQKGAAQWQPGRRLAFANDPLNLLAVDASTNRAKGDGDTATWLPPDKTFRCSYVARQVAVKEKYAVRVTPAERDAMVRVLSTCPDRALPAPGSAPVVAALPRGRAAAPRTTPSAPRVPARTVPHRPAVVHPGAFCAPPGATGVTTAGTPMGCSTRPGDDRARWRSR